MTPISDCAYLKREAWITVIVLKQFSWLCPDQHPDRFQSESCFLCWECVDSPWQGRSCGVLAGCYTAARTQCSWAGLLPLTRAFPRPLTVSCPFWLPFCPLLLLHRKDCGLPCLVIDTARRGVSERHFPCLKGLRPFQTLELSHTSFSPAIPFRA